MVGTSNLSVPEMAIEFRGQEDAARGRCGRCYRVDAGAGADELVLTMGHGP